MICVYDAAEPATYLVVYGCPDCQDILEVYLCYKHLKLVTETPFYCEQNKFNGHRYTTCNQKMEILWQPIHPEFEPPFHDIPF